VVQHQHHQSRAIGGPSVFQHFRVASRVAKRRARTTADLQMNALFGLLALLSFSKSWGSLVKNGLPFLS
jgi:hypothetical protein